MDTAGGRLYGPGSERYAKASERSLARVAAQLAGEPGSSSEDAGAATGSWQEA